MQGLSEFLAGSFVSDLYQNAPQHFSEIVSMSPIDAVFHQLQLEKLDFIKIDHDSF